MRTLAFAAGLLALVGCSDPAPAVDERALLISQRMTMLNRARATGADLSKFECAARTVSDRTAETMLLMWVNERTDLVDRADLLPASDDMISAFETCGANMSQIMNEMERSDDLLMQGLAAAILLEGRGLDRAEGPNQRQP